MYRLVKPLVFLLEPERAHELATLWMRASARLPIRTPSLPVDVLGLRFPNPVGLAAGMDKGRALVRGWFRMGFGHVEIGTITPRPQPGNPRPRLFRLVDERGIINRMGFNNDGAEAVAARLRAVSLALSPQPGPVGINIGRNKDTPNERAAEDYLACLRALGPLADYVTVNVSSPNTEGLRALQGQIGGLVRALRSETQKPLLVKLSPDEQRLAEMAVAAVEAGANGLIVSNTTLDRTSVSGHPRAGEQGGLSGAPLRARALEACRRVFRAVGREVPIVGVGGIGSAEDAYARIRAGASLVQIYTGLVYEGPGLPRAIIEGLRALLARDGLTLREAIGVDA